MAVTTCRVMLDGKHVADSDAENKALDADEALQELGADALAIGRGLIGLGVAGALMAGLKAIVLWFPPQRIALANGWFIMLGALGAVTATAPAEIVLAHMGWRGVFAVLAAVTATSALLILLVVPERRQSGDRAAMRVRRLTD